MSNEKPEKLPIQGFEGLYSIDALGNVTSDEREILQDDGTTKIRKQRAVKHSKNSHGSVQVVLVRDGKRTTLRIYTLLMGTYGDLEVAKSFLAESDSGAGRGKTYEFINPDGDYVKIVGLSRFAEANGLHASNLCQVHAGKIPSCKGWTKYIPNEGIKPEKVTGEINEHSEKNGSPES